MRWIREDPPRWDAEKARIVGAAPAGVFDFSAQRPGELVPGEWWRVEDEGQVLGYGWMDCTWGDAEVLLAVDPAARHRGVGTFILDHLETEAAARGLNYLYNVVGATHPEQGTVARWLMERRFEAAGDVLLKRRVRPR
ncbi:MAG TPA: GNAT family N-acetyltransferase [Candidatus Polarisedimenticolaceae bacterium]|nr:GNAT family N-acetyltransferase [Candidatus Polarisedimenticolaceae bacterium]